MNAASDQFASARKDALARMQKRWGLDRKDTEKPEGGSDEPNEIPFIELSDEDLDLALRIPTPAHLADLKQALREIRQERYAELQETPDGNTPAAPPSKRSELLAEIASEHFRAGMISWLTSIPVDHGLSSTPADELVRIQEEMRYRLKLVKAIENMMSREIEGLETQIVARRLLDAKGGDQ
jgi:hypothetical protein